MIRTAEIRGFVFSIVFILIYGALLANIPIGLQGQGTTPDTITPVDPTLLTGWSETETYTYANTTPNIIGVYYDYELGSRSWRFQYDDTGDYFTLSEKILWFIFVIDYDLVQFTNASGFSRGDSLSFTEIDADLNSGSAVYSMMMTDSGKNAGDYIIYYNTTTYDNASAAWDGGGLYFLHGVGFDSSAGADAGSLLISLLTLSVPDVPEIIQVIVLSPIFACVCYLIWFIVKETLPFV